MKIPKFTIFLPLLFIGSQLYSVQTSSFVDEGYKTFAEGNLEGAALHWDGSLGTGPSLEKPFQLPEGSLIWELLIGSNGYLYAATGGPGAVFRINPKDGSTKKLLDPDKPLLRAIYLDEDNNLYAGSSPDGRIYRVSEQGGFPEIITDLNSSYIWAIESDPYNEGAILIAAGAPAALYRLPADYSSGDEIETLVRADATHLTTFVYGPNQTLYYGTGPYGHLYKKNKDAEPRILAELGRGEVRSIFPQDDGSLQLVVYQSDRQGSSGRSPDTATGSSEGLTSGVYRISPDGFVEILWQEEDEKIFVGVRQGEDILMGSDTKGRLFRFADRYDWSLLTESPQGGEISALAVVDEDLAWVATSNPVTISPFRYDTTAKGVYTSRVKDAGQRVRWGAISVAGLQVDSMNWEIRTGDRSEVDSSWENWKPLTNGKIQSGPGRYLQYRTTFEKPAAALRRVEFYYQLPNQAPVFRRVKGLPVRLESIPTPPQPPGRATLNQLFGGNTRNNSDSPQPFVVYEETGWLSIVWEASDPNDDELLFTVYIRKLDDTDWLLLADSIRQPFYSINVSGFKPGYYEPRIVASDRLSNPPGMERTSEVRGDLMLVDNEPPQIHPPQSAAPRSFTVEDRFSIITKVSYRIDGGETRAILPDNKIYDSKKLHFTLPEGSVSDGSTLLIDALDARGNRATWTGRIRISEEDEGESTNTIE